MMLPKLDVPTHTFEIPSTGKKIKFRPFTVKEQKLLLMANEDKENNDIYDTLKQLVENCVVTPKFKFEDLALFDLENFFIQLRAKSIGEIVTLDYVCKHIVNDAECGAPMKIELDLKTIKPEVMDPKNKKIFFTDKVGVVMRYPNSEMIKKSSKFLTNNESAIDSLAFDLVVDCVEYIFDDEKIYYAKDIERDEIVDFIERLTTKDFEKVQKFIESMPVTKVKLEHDCKKCGHHHVINVEGLANFFD